MTVNGELLDGLARRVDRESRTVGQVRVEDAFATIEDVVPGAQLVNGCIGIRQTVDPLVTDLHDTLNQLYLDIHAGIAVIRRQDEDNADRLGQAGGR